jgi:hypothetical protein
MMFEVTLRVTLLMQVLIYFLYSQLGARRIHTVRVRGGNKKYRALRLDQGNFSWGSEG